MFDNANASWADEIRTDNGDRQLPVPEVAQPKAHPLDPIAPVMELEEELPIHAGGVGHLADQDTVFVANDNDRAMALSPVLESLCSPVPVEGGDGPSGSGEFLALAATLAATLAEGSDTADIETFAGGSAFENELVVDGMVALTETAAIHPQVATVANEPTILAEGIDAQADIETFAGGSALENEIVVDGMAALMEAAAIHPQVPTATHKPTIYEVLKNEGH